MGTLLCLLAIVKIVLCGVLLQGTSWKGSSRGLAMAESREKTKVSPEDGASASGGSIDLLKEKEKELEAKEAYLKEKEKELLPLKKEVEAKLAELHELEMQLADFAKKLAEREQALHDEKMKHLVDLYAAMEPARAAAIMGQLKIDTVVRILQNMRGKSAGKIVAMMKTDRGATVSERLSRLE